ncbi:MAG: isochorismatase family cysteine hydrolase [Pyrinomonadaceae bacterium]
MALLIIDMLNDFFRQHAHLAEQRSSLVTSINTLVEAFRDQGQPVFWVRQEFATDLHDAFLEMRKHNLHVTIAGTDGCEILPELDQRPTDQTIVKKRYSAFFGTELEATLKHLRPEVLVVAGINTHACVRTTVIDAYQRDYEVVVATECIASNDEEHHDVTKRYLDGGIARLLPNSEIIKMLVS